MIFWLGEKNAFTSDDMENSDQSRTLSRGRCNFASSVVRDHCFKRRAAAKKLKFRKLTPTNSASNAASSSNCSG